MGRLRRGALQSQAHRSPCFPKAAWQASKGRNNLTYFQLPSLYFSLRLWNSFFTPTPFSKDNLLLWLYSLFEHLLLLSAILVFESLPPHTLDSQLFFDIICHGWLLLISLMWSNTAGHLYPSMHYFQINCDLLVYLPKWTTWETIDSCFPGGIVFLKKRTTFPMSFKICLQKFVDAN